MRSVAVASRSRCRARRDAAPVHSQTFNGVREPPGHGAEAQLLAAQSREGASAARRTSRRGARRRHHEQHRPDERQSEGAGHGHGGGVGGEGSAICDACKVQLQSQGSRLQGSEVQREEVEGEYRRGAYPPPPHSRSLVREEIGWRATVLKTGPDGGSGHCGWRGGRGGGREGGCRGRINNSGHEGCGVVRG